MHNISRYVNSGKYLVSAVLSSPSVYSLAFVWNRTLDTSVRKAMAEAGVAEDQIMTDLADCARYKPDVIVEVAHPNISKQVRVFFKPKSW
jgi:hypothetical protein